MKHEQHIPPDHPRAASLRVRERLVSGAATGVVALDGLIAHGRGEAFDYLLGEQTTEPARRALRAAAAVLLLARHPVISVNGNIAALVPRELVELSRAVPAALEVNLFHRSHRREEAVARTLVAEGAMEVLGVGDGPRADIPELSSARRRVDVRGIYRADTVLVPLEDGDRTEALVRLGKRVIAIDLNPLSRTARAAHITIVDNVVRALPALVHEVRILHDAEPGLLRYIVDNFENHANLGSVLQLIDRRLEELAAEEAIAMRLPRAVWRQRTRRS